MLLVSGKPSDKSAEKILFYVSFRKEGKKHEDDKEGSFTGGSTVGCGMRGIFHISGIQTGNC